MALADKPRKQVGSQLHRRLGASVRTVLVPLLVPLLRPRLLVPPQAVQRPYDVVDPPLTDRAPASILGVTVSDRELARSAVVTPPTIGVPSVRVERLSDLMHPLPLMGGPAKRRPYLRPGTWVGLLPVPPLAVRLALKVPPPLRRWMGPGVPTLVPAIVVLLVAQLPDHGEPQLPLRPMTVQPQQKPLTPVAPASDKLLVGLVVTSMLVALLPPVSAREELSVEEPRLVLMLHRLSTPVSVVPIAQLA